MNIENNTPAYIEESNDINILKKHISIAFKDKKFQKGHVNMAFDLLVQILYRMYKKTSFELLVTRSTIIKEAELFSKTASDLIKEAQWSKSTGMVVFRVLKNILYETATNEDFVNRLIIETYKPIRKSILPMKYNNMDETSSCCILLNDWVKIIKLRSKNKSEKSISNIMYFIINNCLHNFNIDLEIVHTTQEIKSLITPQITQETVNKICGENKDRNRKLSWLLFFIKEILGIVPDEKIFNKKSTFKIDMDDDGSDKHRIPVHELELLYEASKTSVFEELIYLLMLTTGMRIGGLVNIKINNIADIVGKEIEIKNVGRTIEKGNKWFSFCLSPRVKELVYLWLTKHRPASSSTYLFSGRLGGDSHITTSAVRGTFYRIADRASINAKHIHPHSLRHSYAHILLETGNNVEIVSKLLGHSNISTTQTFYLKENAAETSQRANIPWLEKTNREKKVVPSFLTEHTKPKETPATPKREKNRMKNLARIDMFLDK